MSLRLEAALKGDLKKLLAADAKNAERAATKGIREAAVGLKTELRSEILRAGLGQRLANSIRSDVYPKGQDSVSAAAVVKTNAPNIINTFDTGATIRSKEGFYLAVPTDNAPKEYLGKPVTPSNWPTHLYGRLRFVYRPGRPPLLVADNLRASYAKGSSTLRGFKAPSATWIKRGKALVTVPMFTLVAQVTLRKRFDSAAIAARWQARVPELILKNWETK